MKFHDEQEMKLSIITINYNNLEGLKRTFSSVINQSFRDFEWIIVDGGSTDGSVSFLEDNRGLFSRLISEKDNGIYDALNKGGRLATGDYIFFLNSGDCFYSSEVLSSFFENKDNEDADFLYGDVCYCYPDRDDIGKQPEELTLQYLRKNPLNHQTTFVKRERFAEVGGFDTRYAIVADWHMQVKLMLAGARFKYRNVVVCRYDITGFSSQNKDRMEKERELFFKELIPDVYLKALDELYTFDNKPCILTRNYCSQSKVYTRMIRSFLHFITFINSKRW